MTPLKTRFENDICITWSGMKCRLKKAVLFLLGIPHKVKFSLFISKKEGYYKQYLRNQFIRSFAKKNEGVNLRTKILVDKIIKLKMLPDDPAVLCVGCRNDRELQYFKSKGFNNVIGIDIFSTNPEILVMDMHEMKFADNTFDLIYSCHSLEHSCNPVKVANEMIRVAREDAIVAIEVPVHYELTSADLQDFSHTENIHKLFGKHLSKIVLAEDLPLGHDQNAAGTDVARSIFSIKKCS